MCDPIERAAQRAARIAELNAVQTTHGDDDHGGDDERTDILGVCKNSFKILG